MKAEKSLHGEVLPVEGTETPIGVPSGDEAEVEQWKEEEAQRVKEEDEYEEDPGPLPGLFVFFDDESKANLHMLRKCN